MTLWTTLFLFCLTSIASADMTYKITTTDITVGTDTIRLVGRNNNKEAVGITIPAFESYFVASNKKVTKLTCPGNYTQTVVNAINNVGQLAGSCSNARTDGFILDRKSGVYTLLSYPGSDSTVVYGLNDLGHAVGQYSVGSAYHGFIWRDNQYTNVDAPEVNGLFLSLNSINTAGQAVGEYLRADNIGGVVGGTLVAFMLDNGSFTIIGYGNGVSNVGMSINNNGQVLGLSYDNSGQAMWFVYDGITTYLQVAGLPEGAAPYNNLDWSLNDRAEIVGTYLLGAYADGNAHSFVGVPMRVRRR